MAAEIASNVDQGWNLVRSVTLGRISRRDSLLLLNVGYPRRRVETRLLGSLGEELVAIRAVQLLKWRRSIITHRCHSELTSYSFLCDAPA